MIPFARVMVGDGGGVRCARCHGAVRPPSYRDADDVIADMERLLASREPGSAVGVLLCGAEPFGHPELPRLVATAVAAGCLRIAIQTDARALQSRNNVEGVLSAGVRHLHVTLLAAEPGAHDALAGPGADLEATLAGVRAFRDAAVERGIRIAITALVPVCGHAADQLASTVGLAVRTGADAVRLIVDDPGLSLLRIAPQIEAASDTGVVNGVWTEVEGAPFCVLPGYDLHVADTLRARSGAKSAACESCELDPWCGGAALGASPDQLGELAPPPGAAGLAQRLAKARAGVNAS